MASKQQEVILYARVSTEEQASDEHYSIEAQLNEMKDYAKARGWVVKNEFVDGGVTGTRMDRPQLDAAIAMIEGKECDVLLVHELSRLSRSSIYETFDILENLGKHGAGFASVKEPDFDFADPSSRLFLTILAAMNQYYIDLLRMHTSKAKRERARQGLYNASFAPFGYQHTGGPKDAPVIDEENSKAVELAFENYAIGRYTYQEIAEILDNEGYRTSRGRRFSKDAIAQMMRNPFYMGKVVYRSNPTSETEIFDGQHEAIVSEELWMRCKMVRDSHGSSSRAVQTTFRVYLLSQLARCDVCQRSLRSQGSDVGTYYREMSYQRGYLDCPHQRLGTRTDLVDPYVDAIIAGIELPDDWLAEIREQIGEDEELSSIRNKRQRLEAERKRLKQLYIRGEFEEDLDIYKQEAARIRRELDNIPTYDQLEGLESTIAIVKNLHEAWGNAEPADRRDLLRLMLRRVWVDVVDDRLVAIQPKAFLYPIFRDMDMLEERELGYFIPRWREDRADNILTFPRLDGVVQTPEQGVAMPFVLDSPLEPAAEQRIAPGVSQALKAQRETGIVAEKVCQIITPERSELPVDLRRWPQTNHEKISLQELFEQPREHMDMLITQYLLWDHMIANQLPEDLIAQVWERMKPGGMWYLTELLLQDMPAHWVYRYFPSSWEWAKAHTWNLYMLYNRLRSQGFLTEVKRHMFYQPVSLRIADNIASKRTGPLANLSDAQYNEGMAAIQREIEAKGSEYLLGSEFNIVEAWAQKPIEEGE
jgi:DNA invertase Pin-like site-specific DNA recombinase